MECVLQEAQNFCGWFRGLSCFKQMLFVALASILLVALVLIIFFFCWLRKWTIRYLSFKYRTLWEPVVLSIVTVGIFICFFGKKLLIEMNQDTMRNLILLTAGIVGWYFLLQRTKTATQNTRIAEQGLTVDRLNRAIKQLASNKSFVFLSGIRGLEQIADIHEEERTKITQILAARIQNLSNLIKENKVTNKNTDIEIAFEALANIAKPLGEKKRKLFKLSEVDLSGLSFTEIDLSYFNLENMILNGVIFMGVNFMGASFEMAQINKTVFEGYKDLTREQIMKAYWETGKQPRGLPEEWNLPPLNPA